MPTLHAIGKELAALDLVLEEHEGELPPSLEKVFDQLTGSRDEKIEKWGLYLLSLEQRAAECEAEEKRLYERRVRLTAARDRSRAQLKYEMEQLGVTKVSGTLCDVAIRLNNPSVKEIAPLGPETLREWLHGLSAPLYYQGFVRLVPEKFELDKKAVLAFAKANPNDELPAQLEVVRTTSLSVK